VISSTTSLRLDEPESAPIAASPAMIRLLRALEDVAPTPTTVLLLGEPGSGRGRLARFLHLRSGRAGPCLEIRCQGGPESFPALGPAIASAAGGTVILREVGALAAPAQAFLVRALGDRPADPARAARLIATAGPDLGARAMAGSFRSDLFYRLNVFPAEVPALPERLEDLAGLTASILAERTDAGAPRRTLSPGALDALRGRPPASVRELAELLDRLRPEGGEICAAELVGRHAVRMTAPFPEALPLDLSALERLAIEEALRRARGNRTQAARLLHIGLRTLRNKLRAWRAAGEEVPPPPGARQEPPVSAGPGADQTAAILARGWARRSQERSA
jgi:DNA-binding NtrC family response regulator